MLWSFYNKTAPSVHKSRENAVVHTPNLVGTVAQTISRVDVYQKTGVTSAFTDKPFTAGATVGPKLQTDTASVFSSGQFVIVEDTKHNNGLYEVGSVNADIITFRGVAGFPNSETFTRDQVITGNETGTISQVAIYVSRTSAAGATEHAKGNTAPLFFTELGSLGGFKASVSMFQTNTAGGAGIAAAASTKTVPGLLPDASDTDTGVGSATDDKLSLIANGKELIRIDGSGTTKSVVFDGKVTLGAGIDAPTPTALVVSGTPPGTVDGSPAGQLIVKTTGTGSNDTAVITGHSNFDGGDQQWYLGGTSSSNKHIAFINRQVGEFQIWTSNAERFTVFSAGGFSISGTDTSTAMIFSSSGDLSFSSNKCTLKLPNLTTALRQGHAVLNGLLVYDTDLHELMVVKNGAWRTVLTA